MKNTLPIIIVVVILAVLIWFIFKKVLPNTQKKAELSDKEAAKAIDIIHHLPKRF